MKQNNMYIEMLHAKNVKSFKEIDIKFNKRFNFIVGLNGVGKTTILRCIALTVNINHLNDCRFGEKSEVWTDIIFEGDNYRVGMGSNELGEGWVHTETYTQSMTKFHIIPSSYSDRKVLGSWEFTNTLPSFCPLFIGAHRRINYIQIQGMTRESSVLEQRNYYRQNNVNMLNNGDLQNVKQWLINRYFQIGKEWSSRLTENWEWLILNINCISPTGTEFSFKKIERDLEPIFILNGQDCYLEELSAGFQSVLSLIFAIFEWIEKTNNENNSLVMQAVGTVVIDELDVHLHPEWQLTIRGTLEKMFPMLQFIITTHSPHLISAAHPGELIIIPRHEGYLNLEPTNQSFMGWNTDQILEEVMGVRSLDNKLHSALVAFAIEFYKAGDAVKLEQALVRLTEISHPSDTIIPVLRVQLAKLKLEGIG